MDAIDEEHTRAILAVSRQFLGQGMQLISEFNSRQEGLGLAGMFEPEVLGARSGRDEFARRIAVAEALLEDYKDGHAQYMVRYGAALAAVDALLPEDRRHAALRRTAQRMEYHLHEQAYFYELRNRWIDAVRRMLGLLEVENVIFDAGQLLFDNEAAITAMQEVTDLIDSIAQAEAELVQQRAARVAAAAPLLGLR